MTNEEIVAKLKAIPLFARGDIVRYEKFNSPYLVWSVNPEGTYTLVGDPCKDGTYTLIFRADFEKVSPWLMAPPKGWKDNPVAFCADCRMPIYGNDTVLANPEKCEVRHLKPGDCKAAKDREAAHGSTPPCP